MAESFLAAYCTKKIIHKSMHTRTHTHTHTHIETHNQSINQTLKEPHTITCVCRCRGCFLCRCVLCACDLLIVLHEKPYPSTTPRADNLSSRSDAGVGLYTHPGLTPRKCPLFRCWVYPRVNPKPDRRRHNSRVYFGWSTAPNNTYIHSRKQRNTGA